MTATSYVFYPMYVMLLPLASVTFFFPVFVNHLAARTGCV
uniref:Uncharacterized protein n=1 Tax=Arundo donax TaxID=35708 RepID=A0A0A9C477_ARUDO